MPENSKNIRVRFAPSPTGLLHIGNLRVAIFNYLFARHNNGKFLVRIEDTDRQRSEQKYVEIIKDSLEWLGLEPDESLVFQSERVDEHLKVAKLFLEKGKAYPCFCTVDELEKLREEHGQYGFSYPGICRNKEWRAGDLAKPHTIRFRLPEKSEQIIFEDSIRGRVSTDSSQLDDCIIVRDGGAPTYNFVVVLDDIHMKISHVIRGEDHISNTPKQILLYRALGYDVPEFSHVPLILGTDKKRLSKRHGATAITAYREMGLSSDAIINYLGLLGWSPGDDREKMSRQELIDAFSTSGINSKSAVFDEKKLLWLNGYYISETEFSVVADKLEKFAEQAVEKGVLKSLPSQEDTLTAWNLLNNRIHTLPDLYVWGTYFFQDPESYDKKGVKKHFKAEEVPERLLSISTDFAAMEVFDYKSIEDYLREKAESLEVNAAKLIHPIRLSVSGTTGGPSLFEMLEALGRERVVRRMNTAAKTIQEKTIRKS